MYFESRRGERTLSAEEVTGESEVDPATIDFGALEANPTLRTLAFKELRREIDRTDTIRAKESFRSGYAAIENPCEVGETLCFKSYVLPPMASAFYEAGGIFRDMVDLLYHLKAIAFCEPGTACRERIGVIGVCHYVDDYIQKQFFDWIEPGDDGLTIYIGYDYIHSITCCCEPPAISLPGDDPPTGEFMPPF